MSNHSARRIRRRDERALLQRPISAVELHRKILPAVLRDLHRSKYLEARPSLDLETRGTRGTRPSGIWRILRAMRGAVVQSRLCGAAASRSGDMKAAPARHACISPSRIPAEFLSSMQARQCE